jgi:hypothetical protein
MEFHRTPCRKIILCWLIAAFLVADKLLEAITGERDHKPKSRGSSNDDPILSTHVGSRSLSLSKFKDPSTVVYKNIQHNHIDNASLEQRSRCQIIYILGVEVSCLQ